MISIAATATDVENAALRLVLDRFSGCLAELGPKVPEFRVLEHGAVDADAPAEPTNIILSSLLSEALADDQTAWDETEIRIRQRYQATSKTGPRHYVCTVFRHVPPDAAPDLRTRIRKLNLLAAELSRATGLFVIDLDRSLADVGARAYATDFRLTGPYATEAVAREIAATFLGTGFDAALPREARDRLKAMVAEWQPAHAPTVDLSAAFRPAGQQNRTIAQFATREAQAADFLSQALRGKLKPRAVIEAARRVIRRDGLGGFAKLAWKGFRKAVTSKGPSRP
jgi:hypothetical protein